MRIGIGGPIVAAVLGLLVLPACSKHSAAVAPASTASTAAASAAPGAAVKPTARSVAATLARRTPAAAHPKASKPPARRAAATPARRAAPSTPHPAAVSARHTSAPASAPRQPTAAPRQATAAPSSPIAATKAPASTVAVTGDAAEGRRLYMQDCSTCHGAGGQGSIGPSLQNEASRKNLSQTVAWIKNPKPPMPKLYPGSLNDEEVLDIATYVESIK